MRHSPWRVLCGLVGGNVMQEHHFTSSSASQLAYQARIQWRGEAQPSHFQISNLNLIVLNVCKAKEPNPCMCIGYD
jgi:hypothetical protein